MSKSPDKTSYWDGSVYKMRGFSCTPATGSTKGVEFCQDMSRVTLRYSVGSQAGSLTYQDLSVELSSWELKVSAPGRQDLEEALAPLSGDLGGDVRRELSWWTLEKESGGKTTVTIELAKKEHKPWSTLWNNGMSHHRKQHFGWLPNSKAPVKKAEELLAKVKPGRRAKPDSDRFVISRENLCRDYEEGQDDGTVIFRIHFWKDPLEQVCQTNCLGDLFGLDVTDKCCKVFIRGDERSPMIMGELMGEVVPEKTTWSIIKARVPESSPNEQLGQVRRPGTQRDMFGQCLEVILVKVKPSKKMWPDIMYQNEYANLRGAAPEDLRALATKPARDPSPDRAGWTPEEHAKESKAKGDAAFKKGDCRDAAIFYTRAIGHQPEDEKLYSNRSACYVKLKKFDKALEDAQKCVSLNPSWPKAYFRQGQALRGLQRYEDAVLAFTEGRFRDAANPDWNKEIEKTEEEGKKWEETTREKLKLKREADRTAELNEASFEAEKQAVVSVAEVAKKSGMAPEEATKLALQTAKEASQKVHEEASKKKPMMVEDGSAEVEAPVPYRIVCEDGSVHKKSLRHTSGGQYGMGMTAMHPESSPGDQPWIEVWHPCKLRWSQGCAQLRLKVPLPASVKSASSLDIKVTTTSLRIGTVGNSDPIVMGDFERRVEPEGDNFAWYLVPDEQPPMLEMVLDKDASEVYTTWSYPSLLWTRLFNDDVKVGEGLFEADLTDLPAELLETYRRDAARSTENSLKDRNRRQRMTEEETSEESARNHNEEFAKHGIPARMATSEDDNEPAHRLFS